MSESLSDELPSDVAAAVQHLDELVKRFEEHPDPAVQQRVFELLECVDVMHRAGLRRINELLKTAGLQRRAVDDPEVRLLFDLYDLGEGGDQARAQAVVESLRPSVEATGGTLQLLEADAHSVRVRLVQPPTSAEDVRLALEESLYERLPGVSEVEIVSAPPPPSNFFPLTQLLRPPQWQRVMAMADLGRGGSHAIEVDGVRVLLVRTNSGEVFAYRNECPGTPFPLDAARVIDDVLMCPWHGCRFMLKGGRRADSDAPGLGVLSVRVEDGLIEVAIPRGVSA